MGSEDSTQPPSSSRNRHWLLELTGLKGDDALQSAHSDLSTLLYERIYFYLQKRKLTLSVLRTFSEEEISALAEDFAHDALEKLAKNDFVLLNSYAGDGSFEGWVTQIAVNIASSELRRPYWVRRERRPDDATSSGDRSIDSSTDIGDWRETRFGSVKADDQVYFSVEEAEIAQAIFDCRETLNERYRIAFDALLIEEQRAEDLATELGISTNAVYILISRVKQKMRKCLRAKGFDD